MRERAEDERASLQVRVVMSDEAYVVSTQSRTFSPLLIGAGEVETKRRVARDEGTQLAAGIAGRPEHPDGKFMHGE